MSCEKNIQSSTNVFSSGGTALTLLADSNGTRAPPCPMTASVPGGREFTVTTQTFGSTLKAIRHVFLVLTVSRIIF